MNTKNTKPISRRSLLRAASAGAVAALLMAACKPAAAPVARKTFAEPDVTVQRQVEGLKFFRRNTLQNHQFSVS